MSELNTFSFESDVWGTRFEAEITVFPPDGGELSPWQEDYVDELLASLQEVVDLAMLELDWRDETLDAYVLLAHAWQLVDLAKDSVDSNPKQAKEYFELAERDLRALHLLDARFTSAYHIARRGKELAGNFVLGETLYELCESLETWMPERLHGAGRAGRVVVVDDRQSPESFRATRVPDRTAVSVRMLDADELEDAEYSRVGRTVLPVPMFRYGGVEPRLECVVGTGPVVMRYLFKADRESFALLRDVGHEMLRHADKTDGQTPVDFYINLAYAKQLSLMAHSTRFDEDGLYRRNVLRELEEALGVLAFFDPDYMVPEQLAEVASGLNEDMGSTEVLSVARSIDAWLPRNLNELIPRGWDEELDSEMCTSIIDGLNAVDGKRFVVVFDEQTKAEFADTDLPNKDRLIPFSLGRELDEDVFGLQRQQLFRAWV